MRTSTLGLVWSGYLVIAILLLAVTPALVYPVVVSGAGLALALAVPRTRALSWRPVGHDLGRLLGLYLACVGLFYVAFQVFTVDNVPGLFISFGAGLLLGVAGPAVHVVIGQGRSLADLGLTRNRLAETLMLAVLLAAVQAAITLPTVSFGAPSEWLPLLVMALVVGLFEAVFFRAYVIAILEPMIGIIPAVAASAALYALYHVGYGMSGGGDGLPVRARDRVRRRLCRCPEHPCPLAAPHARRRILRDHEGWRHHAPTGSHPRVRRRLRPDAPGGLPRHSLAASPPASPTGRRGSSGRPRPTADSAQRRLSARTNDLSRSALPPNRARRVRWDHIETKEMLSWHRTRLPRQPTVSPKLNKGWRRARLAGGSSSASPASARY